MPKRATIATRDYLKQVPLPQHATSYTVITHETVIVNALEQLKLKGFTVQDEKYRTNSSGEVATGRYYLTYGDDPELGMMFAWANSYDKSMRFKCAVGGFVKVSGSSIISADFAWGRKHTGTADQEMIAEVTGQIMNAQHYYQGIVNVKEKMKALVIDPVEMSRFLGEAFFMKQLFNKEQIGVIRDEFIKPSFYYNSDPNSLWSYYNHMLIALKKAHPRTWMDEQRDLHNYVCDYFGVYVVKEAPPSTVTVTTTSSEPVIIQAPESPSGPVHVFVEKPEITEDILIEKPSNFKSTITNPDSETRKLNGFNNGRDTTDGVGGQPGPFDNDITPEQQKIIDEGIANLGKIQVKSPILTLPD